MSVAKSSQAVTLAALALIAGYIAYAMSFDGRVAAGSVGTFTWPQILQWVTAILSGGAFASWQGWLGPILKVFQVITDNTKPNTVNPTTTVVNTVEDDNTLQQVLDVGTLGYYVGLYRTSKDEAEKTKLREAASILSDKLFDEWFPAGVSK